MAILLQPGQGIVSPDEPNQRYQEYPKFMMHPAYRRGDPGPELKTANGFGYYNGTPDRFSPVLVTNRDQEEYHASQGYVAEIHPDAAAAFQRAITAGAPSAEPHVVQMYPKWISGRMVNTPEEENALLQNPPKTEIEAALAHHASRPIKTPEQFQIEQMEKMMASMASMKAELDAMKAKAPPQTTSEAEVLVPAVDTEVNALEVWPAAPAPPADRPLTQGEKIRLGKERKAAERAAAEVARK